MRQVVFVRKNEEKWKQIEAHNHGRKALTTDELAKYYIEITDDLSYAKTFYPKSSLVEYLNQLAFTLHTNIYRNKKEEKGKFKKFFWTEIPFIVYRRRKEFYLALALFLIPLIIGLFSSEKDGEFVRLILGDSYVNMTLENIKKEDPMAVYKGGSQAGMFIGIGVNNIRVSFFAFITGIFGSFITGLILFSNGIMVGAFVYFFVREGLFALTFTTIMIHGTLELSAIVIAGAAGLILGNSWMFPGTYSRIHALKSGARDAVKIIIGLIPVFVVAAFLEAFVTRHYLSLGMPGRLLIIGISAFYILWYFVYLPIKLHKRQKQQIYQQGEAKFKLS